MGLLCIFTLPVTLFEKSWSLERGGVASRCLTHLESGVNLHELIALVANVLGGVRLIIH